MVIVYTHVTVYTYVRSYYSTVVFILLRAYNCAATIQGWWLLKGASDQGNSISATEMCVVATVLYTLPWKAVNSGPYLYHTKL